MIDFEETYDEDDLDNMDLERQMYQHDVDEENAEASAEAAKIEEAIISDKRLCLNEKNLEIDLSLVEGYRKRYTFIDHGITYTGYVLMFMGNDAYVFNVTTKDNNTPVKKKFYLENLKQVKL